MNSLIILNEDKYRGDFWDSIQSQKGLFDIEVDGINVFEKFIYILNIKEWGK